MNENKISIFMKTPKFCDYLHSRGKIYDEFMKHTEETDLTRGIFLILFLCDIIAFLKIEGVIK